MGTRIGSLTIGGLASGFPTEDVIANILKLERRPIDLLEKRKTEFASKLEIYQDLNTKATSFRNLLRDIDNMDLVGSGPSAFEEYAQLTATSTSDTIATATVTSSATRGSLLIRVDQLAQQERELSSAYLTSTSDIGTGTFTINVAGAGAQALTIDTSNNTLEGLVQAINDADVGATAFIINDGGASATPYRIAVTADETGASNTIVLDGSGLSGGTAPTFTQTQTAQDAKITLDPDSAAELQIASSSNVFSNVINGVTIEAQKVDLSTNVTINIKRDEDAIVARIQDLVTSYNEITDVIEAQAKVDPTTNRGGVLLGDSTLVRFKQGLSSILSSAIGSGSITSASQVGLSLSRDGKLSLDEAELRSAFSSDFSAVASFFSGTDSLNDQLRSLADTYVDPVDGLLVARINGTNLSIADLDKSVDAAESRIENIEASLIQQFSAMERIVSQLRQQGDFLSQYMLSQNR